MDEQNRGLRRKIHSFVNSQDMNPFEFIMNLLNITYKVLFGKFLQLPTLT